jgi:poly [ADP-ribose] polymerase
MLIPQDVGRRRGWEKRILPNLNAVQRQNALLDSLQVTLTHVLDAPVNKDVKEDEVFRVDLSISNDGKLADKIRKLYKSTSQSVHACYGMKINRIFLVDIKSMRKNFEKDGAKLANIWELWHGTQASNVLSILKGGLIIPPSSAGHVTGRMFGDGLYFSDQSTKSLNYAQGYWHGTNNKKCYMFLSEVAMGKCYTPKSRSWGYSSFSRLPKGYDSTFAKANVSGVKNNEMVIYNKSQANLKYLCEFTR